MNYLMTNRTVHETIFFSGRLGYKSVFKKKDRPVMKIPVHIPTLHFIYL